MQIMHYNLFYSMGFRDLFKQDISSKSTKCFSLDEGFPVIIAFFRTLYISWNFYNDYIQSF